MFERKRILFILILSQGNIRKVVKAKYYVGTDITFAQQQFFFNLYTTLTAAVFKYNFLGAFRVKRVFRWKRGFMRCDIFRGCSRETTRYVSWNAWNFIKSLGLLLRIWITILWFKSQTVNLLQNIIKLPPADDCWPILFTFTYVKQTEYVLDSRIKKKQHHRLYQHWWLRTI